MSAPSLPTATVAITTEPYALTIEQAMALTGLSRDSLDAARDRGDLPYRYPNRKPLILPSDLRAWLDALPTTPPTPRGSRR